MKFDIRFGAGSSRPTEHQLELPGVDNSAAGKLQFKLDGELAEADWAQVGPGIYSVIMNGLSREALISSQPGQAAARQGPYTVTIRGRNYQIQVLDPRRRRRATALEAGDGPEEISAPMPGRIVKVLVAEGQYVSGGDGLLVIEAMKMQNEVRATRSGRVEKVYVSEGAGVETGFKLVRLM